MLRGEISRADAMERVARQHLRYVKRQRTWFAREPGIRWFAPDQEEEMAELAASFCAEV
jgi:tRNA dimethylallyltransferase